MSTAVVVIDVGPHAVALLSAGFAARPGDLAAFRPAGGKLDDRVERLLREAVSDPFAAPAVSRLVNGPGPAHAPHPETLRRLLAAIRDGWILAVPIPAAPSGGTRVRLDRAPETPLPMRDAAPPVQAFCKEVLAEVGGGAVAASPLLPQAARVLAAWSIDRQVGPEAAVRAVHEIAPATRRSTAPFAVAGHLVKAAEWLARQDGIARAQAVAELKAAALLGWPELLGVLVAMTREFVPMGGVGVAEAAPPPPIRRASPPPRRQEEPEEAPDDSALAEALREAARHGVPFCIPCAQAAMRAMAA